MAIDYDLDALAARLVGRGGPVQFRTDADQVEALELFEMAAARAEAPHVTPGLDGFDTIATDPYVPAPGGPITSMHLCDNAELLTEWLRSVAGELEQAGLAGRLEVPPRVDAPMIETTRLNAVIALELDDEAMMSSPHAYGLPDHAWWVTAERTRRVLPALVEWCLDGPGEVYLFSFTEMRITPGEAIPLVLANPAHHPSLRLQRTTPDRLQERTLHLNRDGEIALSSHDPGQPWTHHLELLQGPLRHAAPDAVHAFVRALPPVINHDQAWQMPPAAPITKGPRLPNRHWWLAHLRAEYLPDAYAQQVITSNHLSRLQERGPLDPARWQIEDLGHDRHLVTSTDPGPWLDVDPRPHTREDPYRDRTPVPDPDTLAAARADFAPALLTREVLASNPTPPMTGPDRTPAPVGHLDD